MPEYTKDLIAYLKDTHKLVMEKAREHGVDIEGSADSGHGGKIEKGDLVMLKGTSKRHGAKRFNERTNGVIYRAIEVSDGGNTVALEDLLGEVSLGHTRNRFPSDRLIKLDLPILQPFPNSPWGKRDPDDAQSDLYFQGPRTLEVFFDDSKPPLDWRRATIARMSIDGRVRLTWDQDVSEGGGNTEWIDLGRRRYRWLR